MCPEPAEPSPDPSTTHLGTSFLPPSRPEPGTLKYHLTETLQILKHSFPLDFSKPKSSPCQPLKQRPGVWRGFPADSRTELRKQKSRVKGSSEAYKKGSWRGSSLRGLRTCKTPNPATVSIFITFTERCPGSEYRNAS